MRFKHELDDFAKSIGLDKHEINELVKRGMTMHLIEKKSNSEVMVELIKEMKKTHSEKYPDENPTDLELKIMSVGMLYIQALTDASNMVKMMAAAIPGNGLSDLLKTLKGEAPEIKTEKSGNFEELLKNMLSDSKKSGKLPFDINDLTKSIDKEKKNKK